MTAKDLLYQKEPVLAPRAAPLLKKMVRHLKRTRGNVGSLVAATGGTEEDTLVYLACLATTGFIDIGFVADGLTVEVKPLRIINRS